jgi:hypothetical protein
MGLDFENLYGRNTIGNTGNSIMAVYFFRNLTGNRTKFWLFTPK